MFNISNLTCNTIVTSPKAIICELQPVDIDKGVLKKIDEDVIENQVGLLSQVRIDAHHNMEEEQTKQISTLLEHHIDIFSKSDIDIGNS